MNKTTSLRKNSEFQTVYKTGKSFANHYFIMYVSKNQFEGNRLGISVSKKVGNSVIRHRIKRLVKETYRLHEQIFNSGLDIVVIARKGSEQIGYDETKSAIMHLSRLHRILHTEQLFEE